MSFVLAGELGRGCCGVVHEARLADSADPIAVKRPHDAARVDPCALERFRREVETHSGLDHPNIVAFLGSGKRDGVPYLAMEKLEGHDLTAVIEGRADLPLGTRIDVLGQVADALQHLHSKGLVYRNLKSRHVWLRPGGRVALIDFCIAKTLTPGRGPSGKHLIPGTADYLAPEQIRGGTADARSDLFGWGCLAYELLSGRRAFAGDSLAGKLFALSQAQPPPLSELHETADGWLEGVVLRCLEKEPGRRFAAAGDLVEALRAGSA